MSRNPAPLSLAKEHYAELSELISLETVSCDPQCSAALHTAARWIATRIDAMGGTARIVDGAQQPLVLGQVEASLNPLNAPTILCYAHFDVQPADPLELWTSPPFELTVRDGWLVGRGVADDKAHVYMLLRAAALLCETESLPVNLQFIFDGEEEVGGTSVIRWIPDAPIAPDAALVLDGAMLARDLPAFTVGVRGTCYFHVTVTTGDRDLHSGLMGGAALNAAHALMETLRGVLPGPDGRLPEVLRAGLIPLSDQETAGFAAAPSGDRVLAAQGATPRDSAAGPDFYIRTTAEPSVDVNGLQSGSPLLQKTVLPVEAHANVSLRLAPGQDATTLSRTFERLVHEAAPTGATVLVETMSSGTPALIPANTRALQIGQDAFEANLGVRPILTRIGGSIPILAGLADQRIPTIATGFALPESDVHSPNERLPIEYIELGISTLVELFQRLGSDTNR